MRHKKSINHLGRKSGHRKAMLANMASSLILHKRIKTTTAKAKALRGYVEPLITKTKNLNTVDEKTHAQRIVFSYLKDKSAVKELFVVVAPKIEDRPGGYTRIIKTDTRVGDSADMCIIELVDFNETMLALKDDAAGKSGKRSRRRRGSAKQTEQVTAAETSKEEAKAETPVEEAAEVKTEETTETKAETEESEAPAEEAEEKEETSDDTEKQEG